MIDEFKKLIKLPKNKEVDKEIADNFKARQDAREKIYLTSPQFEII